MPAQSCPIPSTGKTEYVADIVEKANVKMVERYSTKRMYVDSYPAWHHYPDIRPTVAVLIAIAAIIIHNTIHIRLFPRRKSISEVHQLLAVYPLAFLMEGMVLGLFGAVI